LGGKNLGSAGLYPSVPESPEVDRRQKRNAGIGAAAVAVVLAVLLALGATGKIDFTPELISNALGIALIVISAAVFAWLLLGPGWSPVERKRFGAILVLFLASAVFWSAYEQAGSSLNLFADRNTNRDVFGFVFPASWFQFVQPMILIILAPMFAWLWIAMRKHEPSSPTKFTFGLLFVGLGFALLVPAAKLTAAGAMVSPWWLTGTYFLHTVGELCLSPVGLSAMTKLAPVRVAGLMMGLFFVSISIGDYLAGKAASVYESMPLPTLFGSVALFAIAAAVVSALLIRPTVRLMSGVK
jgi:POT family proton-dependent oligopeptide transporter